MAHYHIQGFRQAGGEVVAQAQDRVEGVEVRQADGGGAEQELIQALSAGFPGATDIAVVDVSGGCGAMYEVYVEAPQFKGVRIVKQHQMVTQLLKEQIKDMHGLRISTAASEQT